MRDRDLEASRSHASVGDWVQEGLDRRKGRPPLQGIAFSTAIGLPTSVSTSQWNCVISGTSFVLPNSCILRGQPGVEVAHRPRGQIHQQLRQVELRIDVVPSAGGSQASEAGGGPAAVRIADEKGI